MIAVVITNDNNNSDHNSDNNNAKHRGSGPKARGVRLRASLWNQRFPFGTRDGFPFGIRDLFVGGARARCPPRARSKPEHPPSHAAACGIRFRAWGVQHGRRPGASASVSRGLRTARWRERAGLRQSKPHFQPRGRRLVTDKWGQH